MGSSIGWSLKVNTVRGFSLVLRTVPQILYSQLQGKTWKATFRTCLRCSFGIVNFLSVSASVVVTLRPLKQSAKRICQETADGFQNLHQWATKINILPNISFQIQTRAGPFKISGYTVTLSASHYLEERIAIWNQFTLLIVISIKN